MSVDKCSSTSSTGDKHFKQESDMLSLSPLSAMSVHGDDDFLGPSDLHEDDLVSMDDMLGMGDDSMAIGDDPLTTVDDPLKTMGDGIANRLAFTYDPSNLDEDGKPKNKLARKLSRNESEKMRRDRLNAYIAELARLVPLIFSSSRKLDKASVLRLTVTYLRIYHDLIKNGQSGIQWKPDFLTYENLGNLLLESVGGFLLVINHRGQLIFATDAFTTTLGHSLVDVLGVSIYKIIHHDDIEILQQQFKGFRPEHEKNGKAASGAGSSGHRTFYVRMAAKTNKPNIRYENIHIVGHLKTVPGMQSLHMNHADPDICLIAVARVVSNQPINELCPVPDTTAKLWLTQHDMNGTIVFSDQRGAWLTGFLPGESVGLLAYSLVHPDDISCVVAVHNLIFTQGAIPMTVFRMFTKSREILYVRTNTNLVVDMWTSKPKYIISINEVVDDEEGERLMIKQREMVAALPPSSSSSCPSSVTSASSGAESGAQKPQSSIQANHKHKLHPKMLIIPEIVPEPSGNISVLVGDMKYEIDLSQTELYIPPKDGASPRRPIFDPDVHRDESGRGVKTVKPVFLGDEEDTVSNTHRTMYDDINAYMGNDPQLVGSAVQQCKQLPQSSGFRGRPPGDSSNSALSNLQAMLDDSGYATNTGEHASVQTGAPQRYRSQSQQSHTNLQHSHSVPHQHCHAMPSYTITTHDPTTQQHPAVPYPGQQPTQCSSTALHQGAGLVPSTSIQHNPMLVRLLNTRTSQDSHIRETITSHLVPDVGGATDDIDFDNLNEVNSQDLDLSEQILGMVSKSEPPVMNQSANQQLLEQQQGQPPAHLLSQQQGQPPAHLLGQQQGQPPAHLLGQQQGQPPAHLLGQQQGQPPAHLLGQQHQLSHEQPPSQQHTAPGSKLHNLLLQQELNKQQQLLLQAELQQHELLQQKKLQHQQEQEIDQQKVKNDIQKHMEQQLFKQSQQAFEEQLHQQQTQQLVHNDSLGQGNQNNVTYDSSNPPSCQNASEDLSQMIVLKGLQELQEKRRAHDAELAALRDEYILKLQRVKPLFESQSSVGPGTSSIGPAMSSVGPDMSSVGPGISSVGRGMSSVGPGTSVVQGVLPMGSGKLQNQWENVPQRKVTDLPSTSHPARADEMLDGYRVPSGSRTSSTDALILNSNTSSPISPINLENYPGYYGNMTVSSQDTPQVAMKAKQRGFHGNFNHDSQHNLSSASIRPRSDRLSSTELCQGLSTIGLGQYTDLVGGGDYANNADGLSHSGSVPNNRLAEYIDMNSLAGMSASSSNLSSYHSSPLPTPGGSISDLRHNTARQQHNAANPLHSTANPQHNAANPLHSTANPQHNAGNPLHSTANPQHNAANPLHSTATPQHNAANPLHSTANPQHNTANPQHNTANPLHSTANTQHNTANPLHSTANPQHSTASPLHNTANPQHNTANPIHSTANGQHNPANPQHSTTHAQHNTANRQHITASPRSSIQHSTASPRSSIQHATPSTSCISARIDSLASPVYPDVTSTSGDLLDQPSPPVGDSHVSSPDHQAALQALITQITPSSDQDLAQDNNGRETLHWIKALMSDPNVVNNLLDEYVTTRLRSDGGQEDG